MTQRTLSRYVLTDEIYTIIKELIQTHKLQPGEKVNIDRLARELDVSNIPIREALSRLAAESLIRMVPFKGMFVTNISLQELDEMYELRMELESLSIRKAADLIPPEEITHIMESMRLWKTGTANGEEQNLEKVFNMNEGVHGLILRYCGSEMLGALIKMYIERIQRYLSYIHQDLEPDKFQAEWEEHEQILKALLAKQTEAAVQKMRSHLVKSHQRTRHFFL